jgi:clumping factor A
MRQKRLISSLITLSAALSAQAVSAAPTLRKQVDQRGDFVMFGNTLGFECASNAGVPAPTLGTVSCPAQQTAAVTDTAPDIFWRSDEPAAGQATASTTITVAQARSTAVLNLPGGATVTYARIYWAGMLNTPATPSDPNVRIERPGTALDSTVAADAAFTVDRGNNNDWYQSTADITTLVAANKGGAYRISDVGSVNLNGLNSNEPMVGWVIVVFYSLPSDPPRNLALFDGLDLVQRNGPAASVTINGFLVPNAGFDAKLGVIAYEGEDQYDGDALSFNNAVISNAANPADNFFNSTRSYLGTLVSNAGDLPRLTGGPASMAGIDLDVVDVKAQLKAGDKSATIQASTGNNGDSYALGAFVTSIATFKPDFTTSGKTFTDLNGGALLPGDVVEYTVTVTNTGNDASANTVMTDDLPDGVTFVPGSIRVAGTTFTDAADSDVAEYVSASHTIRTRLGTGANGSTGGKLAINQSVVIKFNVTVDANAGGSINNQAVVTASGDLGAPSDQYPTDGNGAGAGVPPTEIIVDGCSTNSDCPTAKPVCDTAPAPNVCVECLTDANCKNPTKPECLSDNTCGCMTDCQDTDKDGIPDRVEDQIGTDKNDADSDDDGVMDGDEIDPAGDADGDQTINALDPDSDDDGLFDGTELGLGCDGPGTAKGSTHCIPDADGGATTTDPLDADTDDGGVKDGSEDVNHNGKQDSGETDPTAGHGDDDGDLADSDGDGLTDAEEEAIGSDPHDADTDDDGVKDGLEANPSDDTDGDGLINVLDPDSDNDGLKDGTELGLDCDDPATDTTRNLCVPDGDHGQTVTSPIDPDTDHGGVTDGNEDQNLDGVKDATETDPTAGHGADDGTLVDSDGDGLSDGTEATVGSDPHDADSDDDGVKDGDEPNFADDTDNDGVPNVMDPDSDGDGVLDGTELGHDCSGADTDVKRGNCVADADMSTTTNPLDPDTDHGGVSDGDEDTNHDGKVDTGERDPNDPSDDDQQVGGGGGSSGSGGTESSGGSVVAGGNAATAGSAAEGGMLASGGTESSAGTLSASGKSNAGHDGTLEGGGCACRVTAPASSGAPLGSLVSILGLVGVAVARRRRTLGRR